VRPLVIILGPTASGKSALAVRVAREFGGEILACDSTQVYRGFDVGTAKPDEAERGGIPHHLMDLAGPDEIFTAGEYRRRAAAVLKDLNRRGRLPVMTAGTGLYLRALLEGLADAPERSEELRARLEAIVERRGHAYLHRLLRRLDPPSATRISPNDKQKLIRAVEICVVAGKPLSQVHQAGQAILDELGLQVGERQKPKLVTNQIIRSVEPSHRSGAFPSIVGTSPGALDAYP